MIDFVNTRDVDEGTDSIERPQTLAAWLVERALLGHGETLSDGDHADAIRLREALRSLMLTNNGQPLDDRAGRELELAARRGELGVHFEAAPAVSLAPGVAGVAGALARLLVPVASALADGTWQRVKACQAPDCAYAFYDRSRNHSGVWCDMAICGNRKKIRTYRERAPRGGPK